MWVNSEGPMTSPQLSITVIVYHDQSCPVHVTRTPLYLPWSPGLAMCCSTYPTGTPMTTHSNDRDYKPKKDIKL